jgi:hypothetical protein
VQSVIAAMNQFTVAVGVSLERIDETNIGI